MTKKELKEKLIVGSTLEQLFEFCDGQECLMYKKESFEVSDEILYIPDIMYYELVTDQPITDEEVHEKQIEWILHNCYTGEDFLAECNGHENVAKELFEFVDWQSPNIRDLLETYEEEEFQEHFGFSMEEFEDKTLLIADIVWEADSETLKMLPTEVWVPSESIHIAAKHLSEKYGFPIKSYAVPFG